MARSAGAPDRAWLAFYPSMQLKLFVLPIKNPSEFGNRPGTEASCGRGRPIKVRPRPENRSAGVGPVQGAWRRSRARVAPRTMVRARPPARIARVTASLEWVGRGVPLPLRPAGRSSSW